MDCCGTFVRPANIKLSTQRKFLVCILSKNKKYPGETFHARVNTDETSLLSNAYLKTWTIWLCDKAHHFWVLCQWWMMRYFKHKSGSFLFSQIKTLKIAECECKTNAFMQKKPQIESTISQIIPWWTNIHETATQHSLLSSVSRLQRKCLILTFPVQIQVTMAFPWEFQFAVNAEWTYFHHKLPSYNTECKIRNKHWRNYSI